VGGADQARVVAIFGPTAVGKTAVAIALADRLRAAGEDPVAISADALQIYKGLEILTGAASKAERSQLEHRLLAFVPLEETFSVGAFMPRAHAEIDRALIAGRTPIVVGGTGLYLHAALTALDLRPQPPPALRERLEEKLRRQGPRALHAELVARAPAVAARIEPADRSRLVRALELLEIGGAQTTTGDSQLWTTSTRHPTLLIGLVMERAVLYRRIDARVDRIVAAGAHEEVRRAAAAGASRTASKAVGYRELLAGDVDRMKVRSRNYAKRQLSWMRKLTAATTIDVTERAPAEVAREIARRRMEGGRAPPCSVRADEI